ncbi:MAG: site-2 protease family protein [Legionella sp.]|nr:site-2 protease family protein [Legionella sp.]
MFNLIIAVFFTILLFFCTILIHEAGHFIAAFYSRVAIQRIGIGLGKPWWLKKTTNYEWAFSPWLLGGYVRLLNSRIEKVSDDKKECCFDKKSIGVRCLILAAGPAANILIAWAALTAVFFLGYQATAPVIERVLPHSIAASSGLTNGDKFIQMNKKTVKSWQDVGMQLVIALDKKELLVLVENSSGERRQIFMNLDAWQKAKINEKDTVLASLGLVPLQGQASQKHIEGHSFKVAVKEGLAQLFVLLAFFCALLKQLILGKIALSLLLGPLTVFTLAMQSFLQGITVFLTTVASLNLAVAFVNLLPVPGLDGGSMLYALIEKIRNKPISIPMEVLLHRLAIIFFSVLFVQLILNDISHYLIHWQKYSLKQ